MKNGSFSVVVAVAIEIIDAFLFCRPYRYNRSRAVRHMKMTETFASQLLHILLRNSGEFFVFFYCNKQLFHIDLLSDKNENMENEKKKRKQNLFAIVKALRRLDSFTTVETLQLKPQKIRRNFDYV